MFPPFPHASPDSNKDTNVKSMENCQCQTRDPGKTEPSNSVNFARIVEMELDADPRFPEILKKAVVERARTMRVGKRKPSTQG